VQRVAAHDQIERSVAEGRLREVTEEQRDVLHAPVGAVAARECEHRRGHVHADDVDGPFGQQDGEAP
jgi:hypothetical protein